MCLKNIWQSVWLTLRLTRFFFLHRKFNGAIQKGFRLVCQSQTGRFYDSSTYQKDILVSLGEFNPKTCVTQTCGFQTNLRIADQHMDLRDQKKPASHCGHNGAYPKRSPWDFRNILKIQGYLKIYEILGYPISKIDEIWWDIPWKSQ